ncbi:MAG: HPr family phosphocarrier protein [Lachnospiraceae bacterium]|nr:HPr family phosphocarrier protein [Lachnospiraceae bacterium]
MIKKPVTIQNNMEMEDRPIAHLVQEASQYSSQVYLEMGSKKINAKGIMGMMSLKLQRGEAVTIVAEGQDEDAAVKGVADFLSAVN